MPANGRWDLIRHLKFNTELNMAIETELNSALINMKTFLNIFQFKFNTAHFYYSNRLSAVIRITRKWRLS